MKGFILAAGEGRRLRPVTQEVPKPLLPVGNLPLIGYAIRLLRHHGIVDIIINTHHLAPLVEQTLGDGAALGVKITYSREPELLGTGGALRRMQEVLNDTFVVVNSDIVFDVHLHEVLTHHQQSAALATMVLRPSPGPDLARIEVDADGRIVRLFGKGAPLPAAKPPLTAKMFTGVQVLEPGFLQYLPEGGPSCVVQDGYVKALAGQERLQSVEAPGFWTDAGTLQDYLAVNAQAVRRDLRLPWADPLEGYAFAPRKDVVDAVRLGQDVVLGQQTHLLPPVVVGKRSKLGDKARLGPDVVVGSNVQVGKEAEVVRSVLLDGVRVAPQAKVTGCLVAKNSTLGDPHADS